MTQEERLKVLAYCEELKAETKTAEKRAIARKKRDIRPACDKLTALKIGLETSIEERKTNLTAMNNYLNAVNDVIDILRTNELYTGPME